MLIISVVVIAVVAAAYKFVPLFQQGVDALAKDVKEILSTGKVSRAGGGMTSGSTARVASRPCDGSPEALRYEAMFDPPPCATKAPEAWKPRGEPAPLPPRAAPPMPGLVYLLPDAPGDGPREAPVAAPVCAEEPLVYLSSARLGRRSRSRQR